VEDGPMKFLLRDDLKARGIVFSNKHLIELEKMGRFPKRVRLGAQTVAWPETEIDSYQEKLLADRDAPKAA
jgi:predicted DNA-binding transcriptional regulator AlpA